MIIILDNGEKRLHLFLRYFNLAQDTFLYVSHACQCLKYAATSGYKIILSIHVRVF